MFNIRSSPLILVCLLSLGRQCLSSSLPSLVVLEIFKILLMAVEKNTEITKFLVANQFNSILMHYKDMFVVDAQVVDDRVIDLETFRGVVGLAY